MPRAKIILADVLEGLSRMADESVQCCITSPPYWELRDYGEEGQIGLEETPHEYVDKMGKVFHEVRRVLRKDGVLFLNLGDSYAGGGRGGMAKGDEHGQQLRGRLPVPDKLKPKDLVGMPWRVAFALQESGWWLRSDIIWHKPNPTPESCTDRPTKSHEYVFLLTRSEKYFWDQEAVRQPVSGTAHARGSGVNPKAKTPAGWETETGKGGHTKKAGRYKVKQNESFSAAVAGLVTHRNIRSVWTIATEPFKKAHFATFPKLLVEPMVKAGTSEKGCCPKCGAPWARVLEVKRAKRDDAGRTHSLPEQRMGKTPPPERGWEAERKTIGWKPTCEHEKDPFPCTVLDPFCGAGTTGVVALKLGRDFIGVELKPEYAKMAAERISNDAGLFNEVEVEK